MTQQEYENKELERQIAKKEEKEHSIGILNQHITDKAIEIERLGQEIEELKTENMNIFEYSQKIEQELAEKSKETRMLKLELGMYKSVNNFLNTYGVEKAREVLMQTEKERSQDKIKFAVDNLKCLKEKIDNAKTHKIDTIDTNELSEILNQQIKELKGENREILFRGKSIKNNEWVFGYYHVLTNTHTNTVEHCILQKHRHTSDVVDLKSVGQYIGLKDKNDTMIFEGDIVTFEDGGCYPSEDEVYINMGAIVYGGYTFTITNRETVEMGDLADCSDNKLECEVIGNTYDNPELLKGHTK